MYARFWTMINKPGHEYTLSNAKFAQSVSSAEAIQRLIKECEENGVTTGRFTIGDEKTWNVFMRLDVAPRHFMIDI
jgi:hydroxyacylglutathione hydrolase